MSRPRPIPPASKPDEAALKPGDVEVMPVPGLPLAGQKAATVLGLKLTGQWSRRSAPTLAGQWQVTTEAVCQVAAQVDAALEALAGKEPPRRLVMHQLLLALSEVDQIADPSKRVAARRAVAAEIAKVNGLVPKGTTTINLPGAPGAGLGALKGGAGGG